MQLRTKQAKKGGRPRKFEEDEVLLRMQRQLWTTGFSAVSLDSIARSAGLSRPSLAAAFGDKEAIYERAARKYATMMEERLGQALANKDLCVALQSALAAAIDIYTDDGPDGCFIMCTAPAEALTSPVCRHILDRSIEATDDLFLKRLKAEHVHTQSEHDDTVMFAGMLGFALHSIALRARAGWSRDRLYPLAKNMAKHVATSLGC